MAFPCPGSPQVFVCGAEVKATLPDVHDVEKCIENALGSRSCGNPYSTASSGVSECESVPEAAVTENEKYCKEVGCRCKNGKSDRVIPTGGNISVQGVANRSSWLSGSVRIPGIPWVPRSLCMNWKN